MTLLAEPITPGPLWRREPRPEDDQAVRLAEAILAAMELLERGWLRNLPRCDIDTYEPSAIRHRLRNWEELEAAANGVGSSGAEAISSAGEIDSRRTLISIKADIEQGTDEGLWTVLNWRAAERIYKRQWRHARYRERLARFRATWREDFQPEPSPAIAEAVCIERISRCLGWRPHAVCENNA